MRAYVLDPTSQDSASAVRGIGRYMHILHEYGENIFTFVTNPAEIPSNSIMINPFLNITQPPTLIKRIAAVQIAVIHDLIPLKYPQHFPLGVRGTLQVWYHRFLTHIYDHIITDSEASKNDIISILHIPAEKISVIYPTVPSVFGASQEIPQPALLPQKYCLYVGDATWNKNIVTLAKAIQLGSIQCVCVGKIFQDIAPMGNQSHPSHPWQKELWEFAHSTKDDTRFLFPGYVSDSDLISYYRFSSCNILISHDEGFGFSYLEASSQQCPSLLSDIPVFHEIAGDSALYVDQNNPQEIAHLIMQLSTDTKLHDQYAQKTYERGKTFTSGRMQTQFSALIDTLANQKPL